ncbi:sigma-w pathway protein ysdB [Bacillus sp. CECT 9360]|uniref:sigma-w pathway protein ysdB n=1 Tax=Bacillus sp. CECT 9360 TaxID=2845821 RepID=UPI001E2BA742|nr:sigma-w pathway protein ysdB [Bacillus sp. CECT 9360]CAH0346270.1 Sigma-w pathway protein YsdB [Bacillus sp. CECT 9360]
MILLMRLFIFAFIIFLVYFAIRYFINPKRKLKLAQAQGKFYFLDEISNARKNFLLTYRGVFFEGEKYLGTPNHSSEVVSIFIWLKDSSALHELDEEDRLKIESAINQHYPSAKIEWKNHLNKV